MAIIEPVTVGSSEREAFHDRVSAFKVAPSREQLCEPVASSPTANYRRTRRLFSNRSCESRVPEGHPLRPLRAIDDEVLEVLSPEFEVLSARAGGLSIAREKLLRSSLLQAFYTIRSERQLLEQLGYNLLFRWFVGLSIDAPPWGTKVFTKDREQLLASNIAERFVAAVLSQPRVEALLSNEHFSVDRALIEAWTFPRSVEPRDGSDQPPKLERDAESDLYGENGERMPYHPARPRQLRCD